MAYLGCCEALVPLGTHMIIMVLVSSTPEIFNPVKIKQYVHKYDLYILFALNNHCLQLHRCYHLLEYTVF